MSKKVKEIGEDDFNEFISKGNVIVDFYADWCGPCKIMKPHFEKAAEKLKDIKFGKVDVDKNMDLAGRFHVMSIPTTIFFRDKEQVDRNTGAMSEEDIEKKASQAFD